MTVVIKASNKYGEAVDIDSQMTVTRIGNSSYEYCYEMYHKGLGKEKLVKSNDPYDLQIKMTNTANQWLDQWHRAVEIEQKRKNLDYTKRVKEKKLQIAFDKTEEAQKALNGIENLLQNGINGFALLNWEKTKKSETYPISEPTPPEEPKMPPAPNRDDPKYNPKICVFDSIFGGKKTKEEEALKILMEDFHDWEERVKNLKSKHEEKVEENKGQIKKWEQDRENFIAENKAFNAYLKEKQDKYGEGKKDGVLFHSKLVLEKSYYPETFPKNFELDYNTETRILIVDYQLPEPGDLPLLKEVKYIASKDEYQEKFITESVSRNLYDGAIYQICLRSIYEIFNNDQVNAFDAIAFNGIVESTDPSTGQDLRACILSILVKKDEFSSINLAKIEPKQCFKKLKGVGSSNLHSLTPIAPLLELNREDKRFVDAYGVVEGVSPDTNLAAMDWQDFEHLIREVFEQEFAVNGGEVKVTQGSRDGGVDAIAFDPDPIRGGKIVIQAKRYTNTVGVSAVRDLYGTVMNEGATKGILISTSDFGPDAYGFAQGKPITLLNGSNLLHLLAKHGHQATINLMEAKKTLGIER